MPVTISGNTATVSFDVSQRIGTMQNPTMKLFRFVSNLNYGSGSFGPSSSKVIAASNINDISYPAIPIQTGANTVTAAIPGILTTPYGFFETIIEGTGSDGKLYTSAMGFLPYRQLTNKFIVEIWNAQKTRQLDTVKLTDTVSLHIKVVVSDTVSFNEKVNSVTIRLQSGFNLVAPGNPAAALTIPDGITTLIDKEAIFTKLPAGGFEYVLVSGQWTNTTVNPNTNVVFIGSSKGIYIRPNAAVKAVPFNFSVGQKYHEVTVAYFDLRGRMVFNRTIDAAFYHGNLDNLLTYRATGLSPNIYMMKISVRDKINSPLITKVQKVLIR